MMPKKTDASSAPYTVISGDQVVNMARVKAKENQARLEKDMQRKREQTKQTSQVAVVADVHIKEEPMSDEESMDTSTYDNLNNGLVNGVHMAENSHESLNGPVSKGDKDSIAKELNEFVASTFKKQYVLTLSELKRLFNLHLASLPPGHTLFSGISDKMLQETVLFSGCKQIMVPSNAAPDEQKVFALWTCGDEYDKEVLFLVQEIYQTNAIYLIYLAIYNAYIIYTKSKESPTPFLKFIEVVTSLIYQQRPSTRRPSL
ncbi:hypothetical protein AB205_0008820, partial [Aquarana catesbeiana]